MFKRAHILIIDDDDVDRMALKRALKETPFDVDIEEAVESQHGLARLKSHSFECAFLDFRMPGRDGLDILRGARMEGVKTPIIMLTGYGDEQMAVEMMKAGASDYIPKACLTPERLAQSMRYAVDLYKEEIQTLRAEAALKESEQRHRLAMASAALGVWDYNPNTGKTQYDERCRQILDFPPHMDLSYEWMVNRIHPEDRDHVLKALQAAYDVRTGGHYKVEYRLSVSPESQERQRWISAQGRAFFNDQGGICRFIGTLEDITERKKADQAFERRAEFERQILGIVGHDIRSPLSAILMSVDILMSQHDLLDSQKRAIERIRRSSLRIEHLTALLLDFTRVRLGQGIPIVLQPGNIHDLVKKTVDEVQAGNPHRDVVLTHTGDGRGDWDSERIAQVLSNLLSNALKYGSASSPIRVSSHASCGKVQIEVHNHGNPIPSQLLPILFQPFQTGAQTQETARSSLGLGLFIVKEIVRSHGGSIEVHSCADQGTAFRIFLPCTPNLSMAQVNPIKTWMGLPADTPRGLPLKRKDA